MIDKVLPWGRCGAVVIATAMLVAVVAPGCDDAAKGGAAKEKGTNCTTAYEGCSCTNSTSPNDFECSEGAFPETVCCAQTGWPDSGTCQCKPATSTGCNNGEEDYETCHCFKGATGHDAACTPPADGKCCENASGTSCTCGNINCSETAVEVSSCDGNKYADPCGYSGTEVTSCSDGGSASDDGGDGSADDGEELCSPKSGECEDSGDCACGQGCFATAVCSSCSTRCNFSCETDADCVELSKGLTFQYTSCVKTSPDYEIYVCQ